jgi:hypothetical protein
LVFAFSRKPQMSAWSFITEHWSWLVGAVGAWTGLSYVLERTRLVLRFLNVTLPGWIDRSIRRLQDFLLLQPPFPGDPYPSHIPDDEPAFYQEFSKRLSKARSEIYNSGDGFNMRKRGTPTYPGPADKADILDRAICEAMDKNPNLQYHRFQIYAIGSKIHAHINAFESA